MYLFRSCATKRVVLRALISLRSVTTVNHLNLSRKNEIDKGG